MLKTDGDGVAGLDHIFEAEPRTWGWKEPIQTEPLPPGFILDDTLVLRTHVRFSKVRK